MPDAETASRFASEWLSAWNAHDLDRILAHYADDVVFSSPFVTKLLGDPAGTLRGKDALRAYFARGLAAYPDLRFVPRQVMAGVRSVCICYTSVNGLSAAEVFELNDAGLAVRVTCHYA